MVQHAGELNRFIVSRLPDLRGRRVLDAGCGMGAIGYLLRQCAGGLEAFLVGVDIHAPYLDFCARFNVYDELVHGDLADAAFSGPFDVVIATEVLEHMPKARAEMVLERLEGLAKERIIVSTPNGSDLRHAVDGVQSEAHLSVWRVDDFRRRGYEVRGMGNRWHRSERASALTLASWYMTTPLAVRFPTIAGKLIATR